MTGFFSVMPAKLVLMSRGTGERREEAAGAEAAGVGVPGALESMISSPLFSHGAAGKTWE
jgi:hypothetical protein